MKYYIIGTLCGEFLYGRFIDRIEAEKKAIEIGEKIIILVNEGTGKIIRYRVKK